MEDEFEMKIEQAKTNKTEPELTAEEKVAFDIGKEEISIKDWKEE